MIMLSPEIADVVVPASNAWLVVIAPALSEVNTKFGVLSLPSVDICVLAVNTGATVSIVKSFNVNTLDIFPVASVTFTVTPLYVPSFNVANVIVFSPKIADVVDVNV